MSNFRVDFMGFLWALITNNKELVQLYLLCNPHNIITLLCKEYPYLLDPYCGLSSSEAKRRMKDCETSLEKFYLSMVEKMPGEEWKQHFREKAVEAARLEKSIAYRTKKKLKRFFEYIWDAYAVFRIRCFLKKKMGNPTGKLYDELPDHLYPFPYSLLELDLYDNPPDY